MNKVIGLVDNAQALRPKFMDLYGEDTDAQVKRYEDLIAWFKKSFAIEKGYIASSSGRVEIVGNHVDHNGGKVLSCTISLDTLCMFYPTDDGKITLKSDGYSDIKLDVDNDDEYVEIGTSAALVKGVVIGLKRAGYKVGGFKACCVSKVLGGAGISSSASFEVLIAEIMNFLYNNGEISAETKAKVARFSENEYFGKPCGLLDQSAIAFGGVELLDFSTIGKIKVTPINNQLKDYTLVLIDTGGSHTNLTSEYAAIPLEIKRVCGLMGIDRLVDISEEEFYRRLPSIFQKVQGRDVVRCAHFYDEVKRVEQGAKALMEEDYQTFLDSVNGSGISSFKYVQNCYVPGETEQFIPKALAITAYYLNGGAQRVHGGGFAGTILNIVKNDNLDKFIEGVSKFYDRSKIIPLKVRSCGTIVL